MSTTFTSNMSVSPSYGQIVVAIRPRNRNDFVLRMVVQNYALELGAPVVWNFLRREKVNHEIYTLNNRVAKFQPGRAC